MRGAGQLFTHTHTDPSVGREYSRHVDRTVITIYYTPGTTDLLRSGRPHRTP